MTVRAISEESQHLWSPHFFAYGSTPLDEQRDWVGAFGIPRRSEGVTLSLDGTRVFIQAGSCADCEAMGLECWMWYEDAVRVVIARLGASRVLQGIAAWRAAFENERVREFSAKRRQYFDRLEAKVRRLSEIETVRW